MSCKEETTETDLGNWLNSAAWLPTKSANDREGRSSIMCNLEFRRNSKTSKFDVSCVTSSNESLSVFVGFNKADPIDSSVLELWIDSILQPITEEIERHYGEQDCDPRPDAEPRLWKHIPTRF